MPSFSSVGSSGLRDSMSILKAEETNVRLENALLLNCFGVQFTRAVVVLIVDTNCLVATTVLFAGDLCNRLVWLQPNAI